MKRTCATFHEYSWHAPFVSSNFMVVVTNGGHSRSGQHSSPHAPFWHRSWGFLELNGQVHIARASMGAWFSWWLPFVSLQSAFVVANGGMFTIACGYVTRLPSSSPFWPVPWADWSCMVEYGSRARWPRWWGWWWPFISLQAAFVVASGGRWRADPD